MNWTSSLLHDLIFAEPALNFLAIVVAHKMGISKRFPAMTFYLVLRFVTCLVLLAVLNAHHFTSISERTQTVAYIYGYWSAYIACAVAIYFVVQEIFNQLMSPVAGLRRLGLIAFRWVGVASVVISLGAVLVPARGAGPTIPIVAEQIMRCVSIMELCLLAFLALTVHSLGRSFRSPLFGIGLGFGFQAVWEMIIPVLILFKNQSIYSLGNLILQIATTVTFLVWTVYFLVPEAETESKAITLPVSSPLIRWNEIAKALGHSTPHVAVGQSQAFFLQDVEGVVDKILTKNSISVNS